MDEKLFFDRLPALAERAHEDQCTTANPRYPLISEIEEIYTQAYLRRIKVHNLFIDFSIQARYNLVIKIR